MKKSYKLWVILLILPFALIIASVLVGAQRSIKSAEKYRCLKGGSTSLSGGLQQGANLSTTLGNTSECTAQSAQADRLQSLSLLINAAAALSFMTIMPLSVIMLARTNEYNHKLALGTPVAHPPASPTGQPFATPVRPIQSPPDQQPPQPPQQQ